METLRSYLENMFKRYPQTPEAERAKAELWQMMEDKYNELIADGKKENEAVGIVISEFGDLEEVAENLGIATMLQTVTPTMQGTAKENADEAARQATEDTSSQTAWQETADGGDRSGAWWTWHNADANDSGADAGETIYRVVRGALSVFWPTVVCIYLCWSFLSFRWWITWIIFPLAAILHSVLKRLLLGDVSAKNGRVYKNRLIAAVLDSYWACVVFVYFAASFMTGAWGATWLLFVIAPFVRSILRRTAVSAEGGMAE